jgi:hypothetical protein
MRQVAQIARMKGWRVAHFRPSRTATGWRTACQFDAAGFPDLVLVRGDRLLFVELKRDKTCKMTDAQYDWMDAIVNAGVEFAFWTPECWEEIERVLS